MSPHFKRPTADGSSYHTTHYAGLHNEDGRVSALCFPKPRAINLKRATWTFRKEAVTCKRCAKLLAEREERELLPPIDEAALDPGIRELVAYLRHHMFDTTDSGDGVSKGEGADIEVRHVFCQVEPASLVAEADRLVEVLRRADAPAGKWTVEANYQPGSVALLAVLEDDDNGGTGP